MRKNIAAVVAGVAMAATLGPLSSAAVAADCYGITSFPDTYACVVRVSQPGAGTVNGPGILIPEVCLGQLGCTQEQWVFLQDVVLEGGSVVLYYNGNCYYLEDGDMDVVAAAEADDC